MISLLVGLAFFGVASQGAPLDAMLGVWADGSGGCVSYTQTGESSVKYIETTGMECVDRYDFDRMNGVTTCNETDYLFIFKLENGTQKFANNLDPRDVNDKYPADFTEVTTPGKRVELRTYVPCNIQLVARGWRNTVTNGSCVDYVVTSPTTLSYLFDGGLNCSDNYFFHNSSGWVNCGDGDRLFIFTFHMDGTQTFSNRLNTTAEPGGWDFPTSYDESQYEIQHFETCDVCKENPAYCAEKNKDSSTGDSSTGDSSTGDNSTGDNSTSGSFSSFAINHFLVISISAGLAFASQLLA